MTGGTLTLPNEISPHANNPGKHIHFACGLWAFFIGVVCCSLHWLGYLCILCGKIFPQTLEALRGLRGPHEMDIDVSAGRLSILTSPGSGFP